MSTPYVLYTYQTVDQQFVCHAYTLDHEGSPLDEITARNAGQELGVEHPGLAFMVLPAETLPVLS